MPGSARSPRSSSSPAVGGVHGVDAQHAHSVGPCATPEHNVSASGPYFVAEQDVDGAIQRRPPSCVEEPDPRTRGVRAFDPESALHFAYVTGPTDPVCLGAFTTAAQAQNRIDLYFGRPIRLAKCHARRVTRKESA